MFNYLNKTNDHCCRRKNRINNYESYEVDKALINKLFNQSNKFIKPTLDFKTKSDGIIDNWKCKSNEKFGLCFHAVKHDQQSNEIQMSPTQSDDNSVENRFSTKTENKITHGDKTSNAKKIHEIVNTIRTDIGKLIDDDQKENVISNENKSENDIKTDEDSLRQVLRDAEQMKQFALNTAMFDVDLSNLKDINDKSYPAICIPMYKCENMCDQRFPYGPTFTTVSKTELNRKTNNTEQDKTHSMVIQSINTQNGLIKIKLDPNSFGLAPFFSDQYETFIKGPPSSIFFSRFVNMYNK